VPGQQRVGRDDESVTDPPGDHTGEPGDHATVDVGEFGTCRGSMQDRDLVTERDDFGFELPAWLAADDHQFDDGDELPESESAETGAAGRGRVRSHRAGEATARLRAATEPADRIPALAPRSGPVGRPIEFPAPAPSTTLASSSRSSAARPRSTTWTCSTSGNATSAGMRIT
jgi:hypothetical protein